MRCDDEDVDGDDAQLGRHSSSRTNERTNERTNGTNKRTNERTHERPRAWLALRLTFRNRSTVVVWFVGVFVRFRFFLLPSGVVVLAGVARDHKPIYHGQFNAPPTTFHFDNTRSLCGPLGLRRPVIGWVLQLRAAW